MTVTIATKLWNCLLIIIAGYHFIVGDSNLIVVMFSFVIVMFAR